MTTILFQKENNGIRPDIYEPIKPLPVLEETGKFHLLGDKYYQCLDIYIGDEFICNDWWLKRLEMCQALSKHERT
jgi:hypothetical protein